MYLLQAFFRSLNSQYLAEWIHCEISFRGNICSFISLYPSPGQSQDVFWTIADKLELNLYMIDTKNPYLIVILGDFNSKLSNWYKYNKTVYEGSKNQCYIISLWIITINSRNNPYIIKLVPLHWPNIYISTQSCNEIRSPFFATLKLPSPTSIWSLIWNCVILHILNARYGIINMRMLIKPKDQLNSFLGKRHLEIFTLLKWSIFLIKL